MTIGHYIREARQRNGLSVEQVVALVPVLAALEAYEKGAGVAMLDAAERNLVELVGCGLHQLEAALGPIGPPTRLELSALDHAIAAAEARADAADKKLAALMEAQKPGGEWHVRLWDAINAYAATTTSQTSVARQKAVVVVEAALRAARGEP